ncbi:uncharacterized protein MONBRDRAFT_13080 [Monosiga brevicollis MX1]|uniref:Retroviral polymerase SH3-like domain-containing protein n=1 Tax=Monosiga brevicollis TaxID=81824 RepID=A9VE79_MONBE|nr:uncharacterized protein MONBRDRAFT_13080 [Monosiga brevicollis MX1]EDQ84172.1 predicted protein [Monosiga brevicollis MX1]|eukprot:XP_001751026.1 hypothetical protein [Monosiga brevicollis MX1]
MNGAIETVFRELRDTMALLLHDSGRDPSFWALAAKHAEYLINIRPKEHLNGYCAYELLTGIKPHDIRDLHPFGADAFAFDPLRRGGKLGPKARHGIYVGFSPTSLSHKVYCPDTNTIIETIHVKVVPRARGEGENATVPPQHDQFDDLDHDEPTTSAADFADSADSADSTTSTTTTTTIIVTDDLDDDTDPLLLDHPHFSANITTTDNYNKLPATIIKYLDDIVLMGPAEDVAADVEIVKARAESAGLHLQPSKSRFYMPRHHPASIAAIESVLPDAVRETANTGMTVLGTPIGRREWMTFSTSV